MHKLKNIKWLPVLMALTILAIAAFQYYWLLKAYEREKKTLEMRTFILFRETVRSLQASKLKLDKIGDSTGHTNIVIHNEFDGNRLPEHKHVLPRQKMEGMMDVLMQKANDPARKNPFRISRGNGDTLHIYNKGLTSRQSRLMQFLFDVDSLQDSVTVKELDVAYKKRLDEQSLNVPFIIKRVPTIENKEPVFNEVTLGFANPITYRVDLEDTSSFLLKRISVPILFSVFLVGFTILSFSLLYGNLLRQRRLTNIKNEFISNITHELKTPIATVSVAIEALRSFNGSINPERTKEYLDISANELQRLSLLVDKVLKLSMFEKKEVELRKEELDMKDLVNEVTSSMRLQFEKHNAQVQVRTEGDTCFEGDRLHLVSVLFNLIDNALKYSSGQPVINIAIKGGPNKVMLSVKDSGIGIPAEYQGKVFEKFFRVPTGNVHNAKGYGLGLSYVADVIQRHHGTIKVESIVGDGSRFVIQLPKHLS